MRFKRQKFLRFQLDSLQLITDKSLTGSVHIKLTDDKFFSKIPALSLSQNNFYSGLEYIYKKSIGNKIYYQEQQDQYENIFLWCTRKR